MKRFLVLLLCLLLALSPMTLVGCGGDGTLNDNQEEIDETRTQLFVGVLTCGVGFTFAYELKDAYEALNPNVQVMVDEMDSSGDGPAKVVAMNSDRQDVNFMVNVRLSDFVNIISQSSNLCLDITDMVTDDADGAGSIHQKMYTQEKNYHNVGTEENPKYFTLPWYSSYMSTSYDVELFETGNGGIGYYNLDEYKGLDCIDGTADDCWGPDGVEGTYDDGFPATWEDMKHLLVELKGGDNVTPFTWTAYEGYLPSWLAGIQASYEGANNYSILQTFNGTYYSSDADPLVITEQNGYLAAAQNGKLAAMKTLEYIVDNNFVTDASLSDGNTYGHLKAQQAYLESAFVSGNRIAFINEGNYWENEAREYFKELERDEGAEYGYGQRRFGYFPWPKYIGSADIPDQLNTKRTMLAQRVKDEAPTVAIKKSTTVPDIAKDFLQFAYSDLGNANFFRDSGMLRPFDYNKELVTEEYFENLTPYQRSVYEAATEENVERITGANRTGLMQEAGGFIQGMCGFSVKGVSSDPALAIKRDGYTAVTYMAAVKAYYTQELWSSTFFNK